MHGEELWGLVGTRPGIAGTLHRVGVAFARASSRRAWARPSGRFDLVGDRPQLVLHAVSLRILDFHGRLQHLLGVLKVLLEGVRGLKVHLLSMLRELLLDMLLQLLQRFGGLRQLLSEFVPDV